jgi:hypothetical protein
VPNVPAIGSLARPYNNKILQQETARTCRCRPSGCCAAAADAAVAVVLDELVAMATTGGARTAGADSGSGHSNSAATADSCGTPSLKSLLQHRVNRLVHATKTTTQQHGNMATAPGASNVFGADSGQPTIHGYRPISERIAVHECQSAHTTG